MADRFNGDVLVPRSTETRQPVSNDVADIFGFNNAGPDAAAAFNLSRQRGNSLTSDNQVLMDRAALTPFEFQEKYGSELTNQVNQLDVAADDLRRSAGTDRTMAERAADSIISAGTGFNAAIGGVGVLGLRALNRDLAIGAAGALNDYNDRAREGQSLALQRARSVDAMRADLDKRDNEKQYEQDVKESGSIVAGLRSVGRDAMGAVQRLGEDPRMLEAGIGEGIGSLFAAGPVGRALSVGGQGVAAAERNIPLAIGLMEAGGAYSQVIDDVTGRSHEDLMKSSPAYAQYINQGVSQEEAKTRIADNAALTAAAVQGPVSAATGRLVSAFEAAPLAARPIREVLGNIGRETLEEGVQSATGQVAQNVGIRTFADENKGILDDVGSQAATGAIIGAGSAGVVQAPGTALRESARAVSSGIDRARSIILERGDSIIQSTENASPVSEQNVREAVNTALTSAPEVAESLRTLAQEAAVPESERPAVEDYINRVSTAVELTRDEFVGMGPSNIRILQENTEGVPNRFEAMAVMGAVAGNEATPQADRTSAAVFLLDQLTNQKRLFDEDMPAFLDNVPQDSEQYQQFQQYSNIVNAIRNIPSIQQAMKWAQESLVQENEPITTDNAEQVTNNTVGLAKHLPEKMNPEVAEQVLYQADIGNIDLTPENKRTIQGAVSLLRAAQTYAETTNTEPEKGIDIVNRQIETSGGLKQYQYSMQQHTRRIAEAAQRGDQKAVRDRLNDLGLFARHMRNKADALIKSYNEGGSLVEYQALGRNHRWDPNPARARLTAGNANSVEFAQRVFGETAAVIQLANNMASIYPEANIRPLTVPQFPSLVQNEVASAPEVEPVVTAPEGQETVQEQIPEVQTEAIVEEAPVEVQEPVSEPISEDAQTAQEVPAQPEVLEPVEIPTEATEEAPSSPKSVTTETTEAVAETVENAEDGEAAPASLNTRYENLAGTEASPNQFLKAFKYPETPRSRLNNLEAPLNQIKEFFNRPRQMVEFMGKDVEYSVSIDNVNAYKALLKLGNKVAETMETRLNDAVTKDKLADKLASGKEITRWRQFRAINIADSNLQYNQNLMEGAVLAGLNWVLNSHNRSNPVDAFELADLLNVDPASVTEADVTLFNRGNSLDTVIKELATNITQYWGVQSNKNVSASYVEGIPQAVAREVLKGLEAAGLVNLDQITGNNKTFNRVYTDMRTADIQQIINDISGASNLLSDIVLTEKVRDTFIGTPPTEIAAKQMRNPMTNNTRQQKSMIEKAQNQAYYPNMVVHDFIKAMGRNNFMTMMGGISYTENSLNINHEKSVEGKNRTLLSSFDNVMNHMNEVRAYADKNNISMSDVALYYMFNVSRVGRLQMSGLANPQADKLAREIFMPTRVTLDMTNDTHIGYFWMTVAQGLGIKTEKLPRDTVVQKAQDLTAGELRPIVDQLKTWLEDTSKPLPDDISQQIKKALGKDTSMHGVHSLLSVAQLELADNLSQYTHYNYLEADGKTNGPIMSLALFSNGQFTTDNLRLLAKGGIFIGKKNLSLNDYQKVDDADLYQEVTKIFSAQQNNFMNKLSQDNPRAMRQMQTMLRIMSALNADVTYNQETGELVMARGVAKNPLTISIYGSGIDGIAGKVTNALTEVIYEKFSDLIEAQNNDQNTRLGDLIYGDNAAFNNDLIELLNNQPRLNKDGEIEFKAVEHKNNPNRTNQNFTFTPEQYNALKANVRIFFVNQLYGAITNGVMGNVSESTGALQTATQVQSIFLTALFNNELIARLAEKQQNPEKFPDYYRGDALSQSELDQIYADLRAYSPIIETGSQSFFIAGREQQSSFQTVTLADGTKVTMPEYARSLTDDMSTQPTIFGPALAGVRGVPSLVIGTGDGQMIQDIINSDIKGLPVFDGFNLPATDIDSSSVQINEKVFDVINNNPMRAVADSFRAFLRANPTETLLKEGPLNTQMDFIIDNLSMVISGSRAPKTKIAPEDVPAYLNNLANTLDTLADEIDVRHETLREFAMSVDQMASAESPYTNEGKVSNITDGLNNEQIVDRLNRVYQQKMNARLNKARTAKAIEAQNNLIVEALPEFASLDQESGVYVTNTQNLGMLPDLVRIAPVHKEMMTNTLKNLQDSGYKVVFGNAEQLSAYQYQNNPDRYDPNSIDYNGKIDPVTKTIYVSNISSETIAHELIHAATIDKTRAYYDNPFAITKTDRDALKRIEGLMGEWLAANYDAESLPVQQARAQAASTVSNHLNAGRKAEALNEFMAWNLSNKNLVEVNKATKVQNPLFRIAGEALRYIKSLIWGNKFSPDVKDNLYSNLRFNTRILLATPTPVSLLVQDMNSVSLYQSAEFGSDVRLTEMRERFAKKLGQYVVNGDPLRAGIRKIDSITAMTRGDQTADLFVAHGFPMNMQEKSTFKMIQAALMVETDLNKNSLSRIQDMYAHVTKNLSVEALMANPETDDPADRYQAQERFNVLTGVYGKESLLPSFLALAMVNDTFRDILTKVETPKVAKDNGGDLDAYLNNLGNASMDNLAILASGEGRNQPNVRAALDALTEAMIENVGDQRSYIEQQGSSIVDGIDNYIRENVNELSAKAIKATDNVVQNSTNPVVRGTARVARLAATIINEDASEKLVQGITSVLNQTDNFTTVRELVNEIVGRTKENAPVFDMISKVRAEVQQTRQQFREKLPIKIAEKFSRKLKAEEWTALTRSIGKTDLAALYGSVGLDRSLEFITDNAKLKAEVNKLETAIKNADPNRFSRIQLKAKQLARYLNTGEQGHNLLRNGFAVSHLFNEGSFSVKVGEANAIVDQVDQLISLYALDSVSATERTQVADLIVNENEGVKFALAYLVGERADEMAKVDTDLTRINHYKGYLPSENQSGTSLIVASDIEYARLIGMGYTRVGDYRGSSADVTLEKSGYYFSPVSGKATYNQGVLQTVHSTVSGIDPRNGFTTGEMTAGRITDPRIVNRINNRLANASVTSEGLLPVFDSEGDILGYERGVDPLKTLPLNRNTNLAQIIGAYRGRQVEEVLASEFNNSLIWSLADIYRQGRKEGRFSEFVNLAQSKDPIHQDTWKIIPGPLKDQIFQVFGPKNFYVRRDMINDAVGFRQASVGDIWTGNSRLSEPIQKELKRAAIGIFGNKAYNYLVNGEKYLQNFVSDAKVLIVIKSVVVPIANLTANVFQLMSRGVPARTIISGLRNKTNEINDYIKRREREIDLDTELLAARGANNTVRIRKIETELQSIRDSYKRLSIWPLIEAGEYSAISDGGVTQEDLALANGRWVNFVEGIADKLPNGLKTPYRYAMITRDTALFQGLARSVQYGDFLGKAILYEDMVQRKKVKSEDALAQISEEYVNYNRLAGRTRNYLEASGLIWFWNFKLRIMKIAAQMVREHPFRALMLTNLAPNIPMIGSIGSPITDNFASILADGKLGYSMGPGMGLNAPQINPWYNLIK